MGKESSTDFKSWQVRGHVFEARHLDGVNLYPLCGISLLSSSEYTKECRLTSNPIWNHPINLTVKATKIEVFSADIRAVALRPNSQLGSCSIRMEALYEEKDHAIIGTWLPLIDGNKERQNGYIKLSLCLVEPGTQTPNLTESSDDNPEDHVMDVSHMEKQFIAMNVSVYVGEDLPRMDYGTGALVRDKWRQLVAATGRTVDLVDPCLEVTIGNNRMKTAVIRETDHPEWNESLRCSLQIPTVAENITLELYDWDLITSADLIGTRRILLHDLSETGVCGFLPTFGPAFINFYGSARESAASMESAEAMNKGEVEGCAYRGRVLMQLSCTYTEHVIVFSKNPPAITKHLQRYIERRRYKLFGVLMDAIIMDGTEDRVCFELSIGNFGNSLDKSMAVSASTTVPTVPVYDGKANHFLSWGARKPVLMVDCYWEDCEHRIICSNIILKLDQQLEVSLKEIEGMVGKRSDTDRVTQLIVATLSDTKTAIRLEKDISDCYGKSGYVFTPLDNYYLERRCTSLRLLKQKVLEVLQQATVIEDTMAELRNIQQSIRDLAADIQISIPDVIIWLLVDSKRYAYCRVRAHEIFQAGSKKTSGRFCNLIQPLNFKRPGKPERTVVVVRARLWLGRRENEGDWLKKQDDGHIGVFAETYENQRFDGTGWVSSKLPIPVWSDKTGGICLDKDSFKLPNGWKWSGDWQVASECRADEQSKMPVNDMVYKWQKREGDSWNGATTWYTYENLEPVNGDLGIEEMKPPENWQWKGGWKLDKRVSTDSAGWEYNDNTKSERFTHIERTQHTKRRCRIARTRVFQPIKSKVDNADRGWEYAPAFTLSFHCVEKRGDVVRRRRWHRPLVGNKGTALNLFDVPGKNRSVNKSVPRIYLTYSESFEYELRAYISKGRGLMAGDDSGLSDVYVRVSLLQHTQDTQTMSSILCPVWDETLYFESLHIYGHPTSIMVTEALFVTVQVYDKDEDEDDFLGEFVCIPNMKLTQAIGKHTRLQWFPITSGNRDGGEILAAFELYLKDKNHKLLPPIRCGSRYLIPRHLKPSTLPVHIEILCWGLRNIANTMQPFIQFECNNEMVSSTKIAKVIKNSNFNPPTLILETELSIDQAYLSPLMIKLKDKGSKVRGVYELINMAPFYSKKGPDVVLPVIPTDDLKIDMSFGATKPPDHQFIFDWWSKFYASAGEHGKAGHYLKHGAPGGLLKIYKTELENVSGLERFTDFLVPFSLTEGKNLEADNQKTVAIFKGNMRVHALRQSHTESDRVKPDYVFRDLPSTEPISCIVRVYIVRAFNLQPADTNGLADPYIKVTLGTQTKDNRKDFKPNTLQPVFGCVFELSCMVPTDNELLVQLFDKDVGSADDLMGETRIDLENRLLSKHRGRCALSNFYIRSGVYQWRDNQKPTKILEEFCRRRRLPSPRYYGSLGVKIGDRLYNISDFEKDYREAPAHFGEVRERLALHVLNRLDLVQEHVETRSLHHPAQPNLQQGQLQMWVDLFEAANGPPGPPVDLSPRRPESYELRVVVYDTWDVQPADRTYFTSGEGSDLYVKGWLKGKDTVEQTDIHYRSPRGSGNFNWRLIFPLEYFPTEHVIRTKTKSLWSMNSVEHTLPPVLVIQIWDNDTISADDFIGSIEIPLDRLKMPLKRLPFFSRQTQKQYEQQVEVDLFEHKRVRGYFPLIGSDKKGVANTLTGKIDMMIELLSQGEAEQHPVGPGRDPPDPLTAPVRSSDTIPWYLNPWKALLNFVRSRMRTFCCCGCLLMILVMLVLSLLTLPRVVEEWLLLMPAIKRFTGKAPNEEKSE